ncbi:MAG TPA: hypothetical protein VK985_11660 [Rariglobus sp.]|nr:hypothetical protein [Rariglobus sp.]
MSIRRLFVCGLRRFNLRVFCWVFVGALALTTVWERLMPRVYESAGVLQFLRTDPRVLINSESDSAEESSRLSEKLPATVEIEIGNIVQRMSGEDRAALLRPYGYDADVGGEMLENVLRRNLKITPNRLSLLLIVSYRHPSPEVALKMAGFFMEECVASHFRLLEQETAQRVEDLVLRMSRQARIVEELEKELESAKERLEREEAYQNLERRLAVNRELLGNMRVRKEIMSGESLKPLLRVLDDPVLAKHADYVRSPVIGFCRWRLAISASVGLLAGFAFRRKMTASSSLMVTA